jgi:mitogen-activated protein kinase organizer 1
MTGDDAAPNGHGRIWAWDLLTGRLVAKVTVPWGPDGFEAKKKAVGRDGKEKTRNNVISCMAWREDGWGDQFCVGGTSGVVTVFGEL